MGIVTTHTEGRVVTHSDDDRGAIEVVQLPSRDAAVQAAAADTTAAPAPAPASTPAKAPKPAATVKAAVKQMKARTAKGKK